jgi:hypothetical protein
MNMVLGRRGFAGSGLVFGAEGFFDWGDGFGEWVGN